MENTDLQMGMNMKAWQNPYNLAYEYSGWMNCQSSKDVDVIKKDTLDVMDENIQKNSLAFKLAIVKYVYFMFIALGNLIFTTWRHLY